MCIYETGQGISAGAALFLHICPDYLDVANISEVQIYRQPAENVLLARVSVEENVGGDIFFEFL